jgi:HD-GYP domain-containing protein (c-di-GMP phosphodiesterase class II)
VADRSGVSRAQLLASLSLAVDLGLGLPVEHVLRQTVIATRLADAAGFDRVERETAYYASLLAWVGCTADSAELARLFGDDLRLRADTYGTDLAGLPLLRFMMRNAGSGTSSLRRLGLLVEILASDVVERSFTAHCDSAAHLSDQLGLGPRVAVALGQLFERWDGKGAPKKLRGDQLSPAIRVLHIADIVEVHDRIGGARAALDVATERAGGAFDPRLVESLVANHAQILAALDESSWDEVIAADPAMGAPMGEDELDDALAVLGDYADLKSPWWAGHSRGVGELAGGAAADLGLPSHVVRDLRRAGFVHDIGVIGVANSVWDAPRPLNSADQERVRTHPYLTDRTFARVPTLARIGQLAALHHERIDGTGYPAGLSGDAIPLPARVLAAADVYHALREPRPHRPAHDAGAAATALRDEVRAGRLPGDAVNAVLRAAGHRVRTASDQPGGLTSREVEVLVLLARGHRNKDIASELGISAKTVSAHLERVYAKAGVSTRAGATLYAMRHGFLDIHNAE